MTPRQTSRAGGGPSIRPRRPVATGSGGMRARAGALVWLSMAVQCRAFLGIWPGDPDAETHHVRPTCNWEHVQRDYKEELGRCRRECNAKGAKGLGTCVVCGTESREG
ncbi:unnamed protein product [Ectocarpus fasciculatus]